MRLAGMRRRIVGVSLVEYTKDAQLDDDLREQVSALISEYGDILGTLTEAGYNGLLRNELPQYLSLLDEARDYLSRNSSQGDLLKNVLCSASSLMIVGGMVTTLIPPHIQGPVIASVGGGAFKVFKCNLNELEQGSHWRPTPE